MQDSLFYTQDKLGFKIDVLLEATAKKSTIYVAVQDGTGAMARAINVARDHMDRIGGGRTIKAEYLGVLIDEKDYSDQDLGATRTIDQLPKQDSSHESS